MQIIAIAGADGSGKSTLAKALKDFIFHFYDTEYKIASFADGVYQALSDIYNVDIREIKENKNLWRNELRRIGETKRELDSAYWIKDLFNRFDDKDNIIIDDLRFYQEALFVKDFSHNFIYLHRPFSLEEKQDSTFQDLPIIASMADVCLPAKLKPPQVMAHSIFSENSIKKSIEPLEVIDLYHSYCYFLTKNHPYIPLESLSSILKKVKQHSFASQELENVLRAMVTNHQI